MSHGHYHTSAAWARMEHSRRPAELRPWRFVVLIGATAIGVSDAGVVLVRVSNGLVARLGGAGITRQGERRAATKAARLAAGRQLVDDLAASWGIER